MKKLLMLVFCILVLGLGLSAQSFVGTWDFYYRWGCDGAYTQTTLTFNADGTFSSGTTLSGKWYQIENSSIIWEYTNGTTYAGSRVGYVMSGMMMYTPSPTTGCFYCVKQGLRSIRPTARTLGTPGSARPGGESRPDNPRG
ncbi:MAG: hypothetical protein MUF15_09890 [Acidobacteria bacterium]|jgi:hypothetical protein|nr:hypothetical protein [Acidobacteriota bacterium]